MPQEFFDGRIRWCFKIACDIQVVIPKKRTLKFVVTSRSCINLRFVIVLC